jgi:hypothetical protein
MRCAGHVARMCNMIISHEILVGNFDTKRPLGRPGRRWEYNIQNSFRKKGFEDVDSVYLGQDKVQCTTVVKLSNLGASNSWRISWQV